MGAFVRPGGGPAPEPRLGLRQQERQQLQQFLHLAQTLNVVTTPGTPIPCNPSLSFVSDADPSPGLSWL